MGKSPGVEQRGTPLSGERKEQNKISFSRREIARELCLFANSELRMANGK
jgi:hypothetical protein